MLTSVLSHAGVVLACAGADNLIKLLESTSGKVVCVADIYTLVVHNLCFVHLDCMLVQLEDASQNAQLLCVMQMIPQAMSTHLLFRISHLHNWCAGTQLANTIYTLQIYSATAIKCGHVIVWKVITTAKVTGLRALM